VASFFEAREKDITESVFVFVFFQKQIAIKQKIPNIAAWDLICNYKVCDY